MESNLDIAVALIFGLMVGFFIGVQLTIYYIKSKK